MDSAILSNICLLEKRSIMKASLFFIFSFILLNGYSQQTFVRQNGTSNVYYSLSEAFSTAQTGDTIYLPGGAFNISTLTIDKELHIFGVGHHPDSTSATYATTLSGNLILTTNASNGSITGVYLTGYLRFGTSVSNDDVTQYSITRCNMESIELGSSASYISGASYITIRENIVRTYIRGDEAQFVNIENNLIQGHVDYFNGNVLFRNNTFIGGSGCPSYHINNVTSGTFENNIFMNNGACDNATISAAYSCIFENNVFNKAYSFPFGTNIGSGNYVGIPFAGFFVNATDFTIGYNDNYHIATPSTYLGTDGSDAGMYGGFIPFKEGSVPTNPHIMSKNIAPQTTPAGDLNISITVGAQGN